ncbi:peptidase inhibitor family I36 protein [Cellulomonas algicola]|uniref:peptidase inhibitor family I36 protein n=1 Tax=Cellulomonas algicola TaxID=2071633 RepID=UPI000F57353C
MDWCDELRASRRPSPQRTSGTLQRDWRHTHDWANRSVAVVVLVTGPRLIPDHVRVKTSHRGLIAIAAAVLLGSTSGGPAVASDIGPTSTSQCAAAAFCVWGATGYAGTFASTTSTSVSSTGVSTAKSVWNRSARAAVVYSGTGGTGTAKCYAPGAMVASTTAGAASFRILSTATC